ncbi:FAD-binding and (Fe-S)-binding domain-containing protein [Dendrosporobacter sp. 1207_IL3150]|uniref:FAD-binding and (Fe-S)-binding domain-containing protein n=1 Tax=Dendrosporobacter sp. 1207_IL3150 TaxID=3084054 RepID=UPI002FDA9F27
MGMRSRESDITNLPVNYKEFFDKISAFIPQTRIFADPIRTYAYGVDASLYRMNPKLVVKVRSVNEVSQIMKISHSLKIPVTFRAAGTSLSGQALTDSVLLVLAGGWSGYSVSENGESISLEPGIIGSEANSYLKKFARKIGPDPASINHAMIGGVAANNASGMCCGTSDNSYKTVASMKLIFADGSTLDTADENSKKQWANEHQELITAIEAIRDEINADTELRALISHKFKIKNTTGYSLNAFVDYYDPFDIINHLMIGSEGTLGFISEITYKTVVDHAHKASALMIFPDINSACQAVMRLSRPLVAAAELIDRASLSSVEDKPGMPAYLKTLGSEAAALLVEIRTEEKAALLKQIDEVKQVLADIPIIFPIEFTDVKAEYEKLWKIRAGVFPAVGGIRKIGTSVIIEDVAFPKDKLAEAVLALRESMNKNGYESGIIYGHALDGNVHFVFTQSFDTEAEIEQYRLFIEEVCEMVVNKFDGALKAEHGTGRNMAPFVEMEWGKKAYSFMGRLKKAFDPDNMVNPDVIITDNKNLFLENLKLMPKTHDVVDKCIECGYCEVNCPSKNLTSTPRQRIAVQREITRLKNTGENPERLHRFEEDYEYFGDETCATDGLCETTCPLSINTGSFTKQDRSTKISPKAKNIAKFMTENFAGVTTLAKLGMAGAHLAHSVLGTCTMDGLTTGARKISGNKIPQWNKWLPRGGSTPCPLAKKTKSELKVVYFPSCVTRTMGPAKDDVDQRQISEVMVSLLDKAGYEVIYPKEMDKLCCGMPFESKGYFEAADNMSAELEKALLECSNNGEYVVLCDTSPCVYRMKRVMDKRLKILDTVEFIHDQLLNRLDLEKSDETIAVHVTCSATKMGLAEKFKAIAEACATKVIVPEKVRCCGFAGDKGFEVPELNESALEHLKEALPHDCKCGYSNSRTCEIGLANTAGISYQSIAYLVDKCAKGKK